MKKVFIGIASFFGLIVAALIILPIIFKDDIHALIQEELDKNINATVVFDADNFHVSFFTHFPNVTVGLEDFGIFNKEPFDGELLFAVKRLEVAVNLKQIIIDEELRITGIYLDEPIINLLADTDGNVNWDIYIAPVDTVAMVEEDVEAAEPVQFGIDKWQITNADFYFEDPTIPFSIELLGLDHEGSGDFSLTVFDLTTETQIDTVKMIFDGITYVRNQEFGLDATLNMDLDAMKFTFKENEVRLNQFKLAFDGWFAMNDDGYDMDLTFASSDNSFKSLLSLVPTVYLEGFEDLKTSGSLSFGGAVKGIFNDHQMPAFQMSLNVSDGMFQYPDLPSSVSNVQMDMSVNNTDGIIDHTSIDINRFHIDIGNNPFDATLAIQNLSTYPIKAELKGKINLEEMMSMFPMEGTDLKGIMDIHILIDGRYDSIANIIPTIDATFNLSEGYVSSTEVPVPMENIEIHAKIVNSSGRLNDTKISVETFQMSLQNKEIKASFHISNMEDYTWDARLNGTVDLEQLFPVMNTFYAMPTTTLKGVIVANLQTKGKMSDLEAERYARLPTSGTVQVNDFEYFDSELLPQGFKIARSILSFTPKQIALEQFQGSVGRTDLNIKGTLQDHIGYIFGDGTLRGNLIFNSKIVDLNEWMASEELDPSSDAEDTEEIPLEVYPVPENIDFTLKSNIDLIVYDNLALNNARGMILIKNGVVNMDDLGFDLLGGRVVMNGLYHTKDVKKPYFSYDLNVTSMSISQSFAAFNTVQRIAPIAKNISGDYSTNFKIDGFLKSDMMPDLGTFNGSGLIKIAQATLSGSKVMAGVNALTNQANPDRMNIADVIMKGQIKNGRFFIEPFDMKLGNYNSNISGSNSIDGDLDYKIKMTIPFGDLGQQLNQSIASLTGSSLPADSDIKISIGIGGTYDNPKLQLLTADTGQKLKAAVKEEVKAKLVETIQEKTGVADIPTSKEEVKTAVKEEVDTTKAEVKSIAKSQGDSLKQGILKGDTAQVQKAIQDAQNKLKNLFNRKKKKN